MTGRHRQTPEPTAPVPIMVAGAVIGAAWVVIAIGPAETADATTVFTGMPNRLEPRLVAQPGPTPPKPLGQKVVDLAMTKLGQPYVWGAKGPNTFDCSGIVQWTWKQVGVQLGPDTYTQIHQGQQVTDIQPGDLIFPSDHHVQLAVSRTQVIEAPGRGMTVRLHPMPSHYIAIRPTPKP